MSYAAIAGGVMSAAGGLQADAASARGMETSAYTKNLDAIQMRRLANQEMAVAQRTAEDKRLTGDLVKSRALAVASAGGGGASDPNVMNAMASIEEEKSLRSSMTIYGGEEAKRLLEAQAATADFEATQLRHAAKSTRKMMYLKAAGTVLGSASSGMSSYGGG